MKSDEISKNLDKNHQQVCNTNKDNKLKGGKNDNVPGHLLSRLS